MLKKFLSRALVGLLFDCVELLCNFSRGIMGNIPVKLFLIFTSGLEGDLI